MKYQIKLKPQLFIRTHHPPKKNSRQILSLTPPPPPPLQLVNVLPRKRKSPEPKTLTPNSSPKDVISNNKAVIKNPAIAANESILMLKNKEAEFDPKAAAFWDKGERVPFLFLAKVFDAILDESGRTAITEIVCNMLRTVIEMSPEDSVAVVYLSANRIAPAHEGLELGIGDAAITKALAEECGRNEAHIKKQYQEFGDLGLVAKACWSSQSLMCKPEALTVVKVFRTFQLIAKESGNNSQEKKKNLMKALLVAATDCEPQYLTQLLQIKLRNGLAEQTLLAALGHAACYTEKNSSPPATVDSPLDEEKILNQKGTLKQAAKIVKQVYCGTCIYDKIISAILTGGVWNLPKTCSFSLVFRWTYASKTNKRGVRDCRQFLRYGVHL